MGLNAGALVLLAVFAAAAESSVLTVLTKKQLQHTGEHFVSLSVDPEILIQHDFSGFDLAKIQAMAKTLAPNYLRLAGPWCQKYRFEKHGQNNEPHKINGETIQVVGNILKENGLKLVMCLNPTLRNEDGSWNSTEAKSLLQMIDALELDIAVEMGYERMQNENEISGSKMGMDLLALADLLEQYPRFKQSKIIAPDLKKFDYEERQKFGAIINRAGSKISAISWHISPGFSSIEDMDCETIGEITSATMSDLAKTRKEIDDEMKMLQISEKPLWISESEAVEPQDRFVDAMVLASKMGGAARMGADLVMQTPALQSILNPTPKFWVSALHNDLVGMRVLSSRFEDEAVGLKSHLFAHCSKSSGPTGGITIFGVNFLSSPLSIELQGIPANTSIKTYSLKADDGIFSKSVSLNDQVLNSTVAQWMRPVDSDALVMPPKSIVFWEIPGAKAEACMAPISRGTRDVQEAGTHKLERREAAEDPLVQYPDESLSLEPLEHKIDCRSPGADFPCWCAPGAKNGAPQDPGAKFKDALRAFSNKDSGLMGGGKPWGTDLSRKISSALSGMKPQDNSGNPFLRKKTVQAKGNGGLAEKLAELKNTLRAAKAGGRGLWPLGKVAAGVGGGLRKFGNAGLKAGGLTSAKFTSLKTQGAAGGVALKSATWQKANSAGKQLGLMRNGGPLGGARLLGLSTLKGAGSAGNLLRARAKPMSPLRMLLNGGKLQSNKMMKRAGGSDESPEEVKYKDTWPKDQGQTQHKIIGRKDFEEIDYKEKSDVLVAHSIKDSEDSGIVKDFSPKTKRSINPDEPEETEYNRPRRSVGNVLAKQHPNDIKIVMLDKSEENEVDWRGLYHVHSEATTPEKTSTEPSSTTAKDTDEKVFDSHASIEEILRRTLFQPIIQRTNQLFCSIRRLFDPAVQCDDI